MSQFEYTQCGTDRQTKKGQIPYPTRGDANVVIVTRNAWWSLIVLSHWPHVATHVATQVAQLVWQRVSLSAACAATSCVHRRPRLYLDVTWNPTATAYQSGNGIPNDVIFSAAAIGL